MNKEKDLINYNALLGISKEIQTLKGVEHILLWDQNTYMPVNSIGIRTEQIALLSTIVHKKLTGRLFSSALKKLIVLETGQVLATTLNPEKKAAIKEWHRRYSRLIRLPTSFIKEFSALTSKARNAWMIAKQESNFAKFHPFLEHITEMCRKKSEFLGYKKHPYDALLDEYEPQCTTFEFERLFSDLKKPLIRLLKSVEIKPEINNSFLFGNFSKNKQLDFSKFLLEKMGCDFRCARLDISEHPFTINFHPTDVRLTTAIQQSSLMYNIFSTIHEGGHGLYDLGLPKKLFGSPICEPASVGIHESQSRLWETCLGHGLPFWQYFFPILKEKFPKLKNVSLKQFYAGINKVNPGPVRVEADEVTYNLHIILRFEIEKALIEGSLSPKDVPEVWNDKMRQYLNVDIKNDSKGCLQDIHWSLGYFGYFPTYTLGNLFAAQLFTTIKKQTPGWEKTISKGDLLFLKEWLRKNIYQYGKRYSSKDLIKKATGQNLTAKYFVKYLQDKYNGIYK